METFEGFTAEKASLVRLPEQFFTELLPEIDDLNELKVALYALWRLSHGEGTFRYLERADFTNNERFMRGLARDEIESHALLDNALQSLVKRKYFLEAKVNLEDKLVSLLFLNSPKGRAAVGAIERGEWRPAGDENTLVDLIPEPSRLFSLYESHIGPLTPLIAEALTDAEATYPSTWFEEAFRIAVENNVRNWRYVEAILRRWKEKGRHERKDRRDTEKARRRYTDWESS